MGIGAPELIVLFVVVLIVVLVISAIVRLVMRAGKPRAGLVTCRACGKAVSPRATSCPSCGEPATA